MKRIKQNGEHKDRAKVAPLVVLRLSSCGSYDGTASPLTKRESLCQLYLQLCVQRWLNLSRDMDASSSSPQRLCLPTWLHVISGPSARSLIYYNWMEMGDLMGMLANGRRVRENPVCKTVFKKKQQTPPLV